MAQQLKNVYRENVVSDLMARFKYQNKHQVPRLLKIVVNRGVGDATSDSKAIDQSVEDFRVITGQQPVVIKSKKAISNFKLRENFPIGVKVTLRRQRMYDFLAKLINLALPRVRDFRGITPKFDGRGGYNLGIKEHTIFPEINLEQVSKVRGFDIAVHTSAQTDEETYWLLKGLGMPFRERK